MSDKAIQTSETRVRMGVKQTAKGAIQMDITAEAPTVEEAGQLLGKAIDELTMVARNRGLTLTSEA